MRKKFTRRLRKSRKQAIEKSKFLLRHPLLVPVVTFIVLFFLGTAAFVAIGGSTQGASNARIVNVFVEGEKRTVTTRAKTVGDLLDRIKDIKLLDEDLVEPSRDSLILEDNTHVNIYKARSVELIDGDRILTIFTAQHAPRLVAADAGIDLLPEDKASFEISDSNVLESSATEKLTIKRSVKIKLNIYGVVKTLRTTASTINELLEDEHIAPAEDETIQPTIESKIKPNMLVSVNRSGVKTVVESENIPFDVFTRDDNSLKAGKTSVKTEGVLGEKVTIYEIDEDNKGVETARRAIQTVVIKNPVNKIVLRGTKIIAPSYNPSTTVSGDKSALMSAAGIASSDYAYVDYIVTKESRWRPGAVNSYSGAYGLCQALPASKMASAGADYLTNPITQLRWCSGYASGRYGSWSGAYNAWIAQGWW